MVGIAFAGTTATYAQSLHTDQGPVVTTIGTVELPHTSDVTSSLPPEFLSRLSGLFRVVRESVPREDSDYVVALPYTILSLALIEMDPVLSGEDRREFLGWEFSRRLGEEHADLVPRFHTLTNRGRDLMLSIGLPKTLIPALRDATAAVSGVLQSVELDLLTPLADLQGYDDIVLLKRTDSTASAAVFSRGILQAAALCRLDASHETPIFLRGCGERGAQARCREFTENIVNQGSGDTPGYFYGTEIPREMVPTVTLSEFAPFHWISERNRETILQDWNHPGIFGAVSGLLHSRDDGAAL